MTAYVIYVREGVHDQARVDAYRQAAPGARAGHNMTRLAFYGALDILEGEAVDGAVILAFPDMQAARAWYDSPAYQAAAAHRRAGARGRMFIIEGLE